MNALGASLVQGIRVALLRRPRGNLAAAGAGTFLAAALLYVLALAGLAALETPAPRMFSSYGVAPLLAGVVLVLAAAWLLAWQARRPAIVWGVAAIVLAADLALELAYRPLSWLAASLTGPGRTWVFAAAAWLFIAWTAAALYALARHLGGDRRLHALAAAVAGCFLLVAAGWYLPAPPLWYAQPDGEDGTGLLQVSAERVFYDQARLVDEALERIAPQRPGTIDLYVVAFAGDGTERVFRNEVEHAERLFSERFGAEGRVLVLANAPDTVQTRPLATLGNLIWALDGIAARMDPAEDIVLVFLTSHGSADHQLQVDLPPLPLDAITPADLADALATEPAIPWKVLVVSACYSGGFVEALRSDSTLVMASARADRTSFGCGADADITYFGRAFLDEALNQTTSLTEAFELARRAVETRERDEGIETGSEPQIAGSPSIKAHLERWRSQLVAGPPVRFDPSRTAAGPARIAVRDHD